MLNSCTDRSSPNKSVTSAVPVIDFAPLQQSCDAAINKIARQLVQAAETTGVFFVAHHCVSHDVIEAAFSSARWFFAQSDDWKLSLGTNAWHRGYLPLISSRKPGYEPDLREAFHLGIDVPESDERVRQGKPLHGPNIWPDHADFQQSLERYFNAMRQFGLILQKVLALGLGWPADILQRCYAPDLASMRLVHYPNITEIDIAKFSSVTQNLTKMRPNREYVMAPHTDYGAFTFIVQDEVGGLEFQDAKGLWHALQPKPQHILVQLGDLMRYWSRERFQTCKHRVVPILGQSRFSMPVFYNPGFDTPLDWPLDKPSTSDTDDLNLIKPRLSCGEFIMKLVRARSALVESHQ